jgi:hypothetical protein
VWVHNPECRRGAPLLLVLAIGFPCLVVGCGGSGSGPAPTDAEQGQKIQQHFGGYREQLIAEAKKHAKAEAEAKAAGKKTP